MIKRIELRTLFTVITLLLLANCTAVKEGLSGQKSSKGEEFLIQKKNPLIQPPEFDKLPKPYNGSKIDEDKAGDIDFSGILTEKKNKTKISSNSQKSNISLEKSILEKIKSN